METNGSVLVVDDDPVLRALACDALTGAGFEVAQSSDGEQALAAILQRQPDLIFLDMLMPTKDGIETMRELIRLRPSIKVIAMSGGSRIMGPDLLLTTAKAMGAVAAVSKPLRGADFVQLAKRELAANPAQ